MITVSISPARTEPAPLRTGHRRLDPGAGYLANRRRLRADLRAENASPARIMDVLDVTEQTALRIRREWRTASKTTTTTEQPASTSDVGVTTDTPRGGWQHQAACRGHTDPDLFFDAARIDAAIAVCYDCPVLNDCKAAGAGETGGVWGGTIPEELQADRDRAAAGVRDDRHDTIMTMIGNGADATTIADRIGITRKTALEWIRTWHRINATTETITYRINPAVSSHYNRRLAERAIHETLTAKGLRRAAFGHWTTTGDTLVYRAPVVPTSTPSEAA